MKIVWQTPAGKMTLLGNKVVATLGDDRPLVLFGFAVIAHDAAMAWCTQQERSHISDEAAKRKKLFNDGVIIRNEMEDAATRRIGVPRQAEQ